MTANECTAYLKIITYKFFSSRISWLMWGARNLNEANTLVVELRHISVEDVVALRCPRHGKSVFISQKPLTRLKSVEHKVVGVSQAALGDPWRNFGDVKASRRLAGGAAGFTHNSHLGMKQG